MTTEKKYDELYEMLFNKFSEYEFNFPEKRKFGEAYLNRRGAEKFLKYIESKNVRILGVDLFKLKDGHPALFYDFNFTSPPYASQEEENGEHGALLKSAKEAVFGIQGKKADFFVFTVNFPEISEW